MTSVAPRGRPVTTSLAPRQRPKGNNQQNTMVEDENTATAFKQSNIPTNLQRSGSLKELTTSSDQPIHNQLTHQYQQFSSNQIHAADLMMQQQQYVQQQQQQLNYYQQLQQQQLMQQEIYLRQQQQQQHELEIARQQQQQQQAMIQQQQQQQAMIQQQQQQQQQQVLQQQKEEIIRQRHEQYTRLQKLREEEEQAKLRIQNIMKQKQKYLDDDFNPREETMDPRLCHSVEPPSCSKQVESVDNSGRTSPNPFEDDFSQSTPDLSNPFADKSSDDIMNPFETKKKTHNRSHSDTFTRLASNRTDHLGVGTSSNKNKQPSPRLSPIPSGSINVTSPLSIDTSEENMIVTDGPNPFKNAKKDEKSLKNDSQMEILLALDDDDDEQFRQLQQELEHLGVMKEIDQDLEQLGIQSKPAQTISPAVESARGGLDVSRNDASPLLSPPIQQAVGERKYIYKRTSSCSSSNHSNSSTEDEGADTDAHAYQDCNSAHAHLESGSEVVNVDEEVLNHTAEVLGQAWTKSSVTTSNDGRDIFDAAPFVSIKNTSSLSNTPDNQITSRAVKIKRQKARKEKKSTQPKVKVQPIESSQAENPFDEFIATRNNQIPPSAQAPVNVENDPFGMAPMKSTSKPKKRHNKTNTQQIRGEDPFNMAPINSKTQPSKDPNEQFVVGDDPFGSAPFLLSNAPPPAANMSRDKLRKKRVLPVVPVTKR